MNTIRNMTSIGKGGSAEVFMVEDNKVLKLFYEGYGIDAVNYEIEIMRCINALGINAPMSYGLRSIDNRNGIVYDCVKGSSLLKIMSNDSSNIAEYIKKMAQEQYMIHQKINNNLPSEKIRFENQIIRSKQKLGETFNDIIDELKSLKSENYVCHGDFHPDNILVNENKYCIIDWMNAYSGTRAGDLARTYLMFISPFISKAVPVKEKDTYLKLKKELGDRYLEEYQKLSNITFDEIQQWMKVIAAVRLCDNLPDEENWLLDIINN
jgi:thiamine kinase-like enzyme